MVEQRHPEQIAVDDMARELYAVMKHYADSLEIDGDPNFISFEDEGDDFKGLMQALALHVIREHKAG